MINPIPSIKYAKTNYWHQTLFFTCPVTSFQSFRLMSAAITEIILGLSSTVPKCQLTNTNDLTKSCTVRTIVMYRSAKELLLTSSGLGFSAASISLHRKDSNFTGIPAKHTEQG